MTLQKYVPPNITRAQGGFVRVGTIDGLPGYDPQRLGGFYPTARYAATRTFINAEGAAELHPDGYTNYRLPYDLLTQIPPPEADATQIVENWLRGQFDASRPYVYLQADFNVWDSRKTQPVIDPVPEKYVQSMPNEWGDGAVTSNGFVGSGRFTFTATAGTFGVIGIAGPTGDPADPHTVEFGFLFRQTLPVAVLERGVEHALSGTHYAGDPVFTIQYNEGAVSYFVDGVVYRSTSEAASSEVFTGIAAFYSGTSRIVNASIEGYSGASMNLPALCLLERSARVSLPALRGSAGWFPRGAATLPRLGVTGGSAPFARAAVRLRRHTARAGVVAPHTLPRITAGGGQGSVGAIHTTRVRATGSDAPYYAAATTLPGLTAGGSAGRPRPLGLMAVLPRTRAVATGRTTGAGGGAAHLPALRGRSAYYASAALALPRTRVFGFDEPQNEAFISGVPYSSAPAEGQPVLIVSLDAGGSITSVGAVQLMLDGQALSLASLTSTADTQMLLSAVMNSALVGASFTPLSEQNGEVWVVNADTGASSSYENYAFNSFASIDGQMFGARSDGLYLLEGDTDDGQPIRASLAFGQTDFKTAQLKRLEHAYIGVASSGTMYLKVLVQGKVYTYAARRSDDYMAVQRVDVGRGIQASYMGFELYNSDGCDFELNTVAFYAASLTRRI